MDVDLANVVTVCLSKEGGGAFLEDDGAEVLAKVCGDMNILFIPRSVCMVDVVWFSEAGRLVLDGLLASSLEGGPNRVFFPCVRVNLDIFPM